MAEDIKAIVLSTELFMSNDAGHPVLSHKHQDLIRQLFQLKVVTIIRPQTNSEDITKYREYLEFLFKTQSEVILNY